MEDHPNGTNGEWCFPIPEQMVIDGKHEMIKITQLLNLNPETVVLKIEIMGFDKHNPLINSNATDSASIPTIVRYQSIWRYLFQFCIIVGDYESGIIFDQNCGEY
jgi:hypothetical protein